MLLLQAAAWAQEEAPADGPANPFGGMWIFFIAMIAIMYFLLLRPQQKRDKERKEMLAGLSKGDHIMTTGGIVGTIVGQTDKSVIVRVSEEPLVKLEFAKAAVARVMMPEQEEEK
jgi:preprotein translocase subunit YajC